MSFVSPIFTRSQWRSQSISDSVTLWVIGDESCDTQLARIVSQGTPIEDELRSVPGHFAAVVLKEGETILIEDPIRSFPLFYSVSDSTVAVSDRALAVAGSGADYVADYDSRIEFRHAAYVVGANTLYANVQQVQAGELVAISERGDVSKTVYRRVRYSGQNIQETAAVDDHFSSALESAMSRFLQKANGRQLVIPLSGGLDSRLLSVYLKEIGYDNVVNFTYGTGKTPEVQISEKVAAALGQKWLFCHYEEDSIRQSWDAPETSEFIKYTHAGASLPHVQDWYAVRWLKNEGLIEPDAIFLPGHTIVGNMHDEDILESSTVPKEQIKALIMAHHYTLQPSNALAFQNERLSQTIDAFLDEIGYDDSVESRLTALEYWNVRERQTKYINNSVRNYEFFGYEWALPMLDREVYLAWGDLHPNVTRNRDWYEGYVNRRYAAASGQDLQTFAPTNVSKGKRDAVKAVLKRLGLLSMVERTITARAIRNHPMGFNWFVPNMTTAELYRFNKRGGDLLGAYADAFLTDTWNSSCHLFGPNQQK